METAGHFDLDGELKIWVIGVSEPHIRSFKRGNNMLNVQRALAEHALG
jgi:hypothetical protein